MIKLNSNKEYHMGDGLGSTDLKQLLRSAAHYRAHRGDPHDPTAEMLKGALVHSMILEPQKTMEDFAVGDFNIRRGKAYDDFCMQNIHKTVVSQKELSDAQEIVTAFFEQAKDNPYLSRLLNGMKEHSFYWTDKATNVLCKCRPDILTPHEAIVDIKTAREATFDFFQKQVADLQYHVSAAHYLRGVRENDEALLAWSDEVGYVSPRVFAFIVIETKEPYPVATYYLSQRAIQIGEQMCDRALATYAHAKETSKWEGYPKQIVEMDLPNWFYYKQGVTQ